MALRRHSGSLLLLWLFTLLSCASAQQVEPSNGTIPQTPEFVLSTSPTSDYHLQPLTDDAGRAGSQAKLDVSLRIHETMPCPSLSDTDPDA